MVEAANERRYEDAWRPEKESKILDIDREATMGILRSAGAEQCFAGEITNVKFDTQDGSIKREGFSARVRVITEFGPHGPQTRYRWTLKKPAQDLELEKDAKSFDDALIELQCAAEEEVRITAPLVELRRVRKQRTSFDFPPGHPYHGVQVDIDEIREVVVGGERRRAKTKDGTAPPFLEVEGDDDAKRAAVKELVTPPGRDPAEVAAHEHMSETDLLRHYGYIEKKPKKTR